MDKAPEENDLSTGLSNCVPQASTRNAAQMPLCISEEMDRQQSDSGEHDCEMLRNTSVSGLLLWPGKDGLPDLCETTLLLSSFTFNLGNTG